LFQLIHKIIFLPHLFPDVVQNVRSDMKDE